MTEREEFDAWWRASKYCQVIIPRDKWARIAWDGWQAARASKPAEYVPMKPQHFCDIATANFKDWRIDIQEKFVTQLGAHIERAVVERMRKHSPDAGVEREEGQP